MGVGVALQVGVMRVATVREQSAMRGKPLPYGGGSHDANFRRGGARGVRRKAGSLRNGPLTLSPLPCVQGRGKRVTAAGPVGLWRVPVPASPARSFLPRAD